ncbi:MAG: IncP-type conjugal transfer protein TrbI [Rhizobiales bacterium]|nr:IncP-type conjugal transfer protein TrbI [Hyphomicrobiales bacterium]
MAQSLDLNAGGPAPKIRRLNRVPVIAAIVFVVLFLGVILYGLTTRGLYFRGDRGPDGPASSPASTYADAMKRNVPDGIIEDPTPAQVFQPAPPPAPERAPANPFTAAPQPVREPSAVESEEVWRARIEREQREQYLREQHRQRMARIQAHNTAYDSPLGVSLAKLQTAAPDRGQQQQQRATGGPLGTGGAADLYAAALRAGLTGQQIDPNGQTSKENFFNADLQKLGYLPNQVVPQRSPFELKRGSVIPATLITGINSDLPGRITAQVSQNVFDSASGHRLLIPQGTRLLGRYDSKVSFGQSRVLVVWTDIILPNGSTLQIGGMAGTDAQGYGGLSDKVDRKLLQTFGSAILIALIGAGTEMAIPRDRNSFGMENSAEYAARRSFAETFGRMAERTISRNMDVQPTLEIRPGYKFNVLVDQDMVFPGEYRG